MNAVWKGVIAFGMVLVPVRLYKATEEQNGVAFRLLCPCHHKPIVRRDFCAVSDKAISATIHGLPRGNDFAVFSDEELSGLAIESNHTIDMREFVDPGDFEPGLYVKDAYYVEPDVVGQRAYDLLALALRRAGKVGIGMVCLRGRERLASLREVDYRLLLNTLQWPEEVRPYNPVRPKMRVTAPEAAMATTLIHELAAEFDPLRYRDQYRAGLVKLAEAKLRGEPIKRRKPPPEPTADLLTQLQASIKAARKRARRPTTIKPTYASA